MAVSRRWAGKWLLVLWVLLLLGGCTADRRSTNQLLTKDSVLKALTEAGVKVGQTAGTHTAELFQVDAASEAGVWTDQGFLEVVLFPDRIQEMARVEQVGEFTWKIHGVLQHEVGFGSNRRWYFHAHRNMLIFTDSRELHTTLTGIFKN